MKCKSVAACMAEAVRMVNELGAETACMEVDADFGLVKRNTETFLENVPDTEPDDALRLFASNAVASRLERLSMGEKAFESFIQSQHEAKRSYGEFIGGGDMAMATWNSVYAS